MKKESLMIIDGSSLIHRAFYALPPLATKDGVFTNAIYGFLNMYYRIIEEYNPEYVSVAFDKSGPTFRHKKYEEYKGHRDKTPSELSQQFPLIKEILAAMNIVTLDSDEYEADDIAGTLAKKGEDAGLEVFLVTGDKDYLQLATDNSKVLLTRRGISEMDIFDRKKIEEDLEMKPEQIVELMGLMGDPSDNIPGVPGIGEKRGTDLIKTYGNIENVYENIEEISGKKMKENLIENEDIAYLSRDLSTIITDMPLDIGIEDLRRKEEDWEKLLPIYDKYELKSFKERVPKEYMEREVQERDFKYQVIDEEDITGVIDEVKEEKKFAFKFITEGQNMVDNEIVALGIKMKKNPTYYLSLKENTKEKISKLKDIFEDESIEKLGHELKRDIIVLFRNDIKIRNYTFDSMIAKYLIDPGQNDYSINKLSEEYFGYYGIDEENLVGKGAKQKSFFDIEEDDTINFLAFTLDTILRLEELMIKEMEKVQMKDLYFDIELPLVEVLASMEFIGFDVDEEELENLKIEYDKEIEVLSQEIYDLAGVEFNINSPKQVGEVLFETLELPVIKKTKTGYSTSVDVLEELVDKHPIINKILRYREIAKLKSTYIDGLIKVINKETGRIHSSFNQTITTTGRISSTEPNLQNIPIRTEDGRKIRKAFIADLPDYTLVDADYSQIELRVLAHISGDENMKSAFMENIDIHSKTASEVFHVPLDEVDGRLRNNAKAVNFGIVYGISDYGLSKDLGITRKEARKYIDGYLNNYQDVKKFMEDIVELGKEQGYVETILHRRRYIPELKSKNYNIRSFGERVALNTPIQGSAADIIKIAMVRVYNELNKRGLKSRLILQVHDELLIETHRDELDDVKELLKDIMESAVKLDIPLKVDLEVGDSWYETL